MRVLIGGGGLGGLTLAHALRRAGLQPTVFERGPRDVDLTSSYRIHIDEFGSRALHTSLPPELWQQFECHSAVAPDGIAFATERLANLAYIPDEHGADPADQPHPVSRSGLRRLLLTGLEDVVQFEKRVSHYELGGQAPVTLHFADGTSAEGDVLVGADGSVSAVRKQLLPEAQVVDTGISGIAGKVYLNDRTRQLIGPRLLSQMTMVLPRRNYAMFMAPFQASATRHALDLPEHLFWVVIGRKTDLGLSRDGLGPTELRDIALHTTRGWHPLVRELIVSAEADSLLGVPLHTSHPVPAWTPSRVTLLGDAIHTMTPLQGLGGNTALRDAAALAQHLISADHGERDLVDAIGDYESAMREYGFAAVEQSLQISNAVVSHNVFSRQAFRIVLRAANALPWLRRRMFG